MAYQSAQQKECETYGLIIPRSCFASEKCFPIVGNQKLAQKSAFPEIFQRLSLCISHTVIDENIDVYSQAPIVGSEFSGSKSIK